MRNRVTPLPKRIGALCGVVLSVALLAGCAPEPDPTASLESLREVTTDPTPPAAIDEYDAETHPEPVVEARECSNYLVITARGTGEPRKKQLLGPVARAVAEARPDEVSRVDLNYPADTEVLAGATGGARTLIDTLNVQAAACPEQRFVLLGYSQGALIVGDALGAPDTRLVGTKVGELTAEAAERIIAVVLYGNPRFVGSDPTGYGDFAEDINGLLPRPPESLSAYNDRLRDYCVADDFICQSTLEMEESGHVAYYENGMQEDGAAFIIAQLSPRDPAAGSDTRDADAGEADAGARSADPDADPNADPDPNADDASSGPAGAGEPGSAN